MKQALTIIFIVVNTYVWSQSRESLYYRNAQQERAVNFFPDSIRIEFPEQKAFVVFETKNFRVNSSFIEGFSSTLNELSEHLKRSYSEDAGKPVSRTVSIVYKDNRSMEISITEPAISQTQVLVHDKEIIQLLPPGWEIKIQSPSTKVYIYAQRLEDLNVLRTQDFASVVSRLKEESKNLNTGRKSIKARVIVKNNNIEYSNILYAHPSDMLEGIASFGVGVVRDRIYPELGGTIGVVYKNRFNQYNWKIEVGYNSMHLLEQLQEGGYKNNIASFLTLSYSRNFSKHTLHSKWTGLGVGYLVQQEGDFFKGKTMKIFYSFTPGNSSLTIMPEFYLSDDFKKESYGIKLRYNF